MRRWLAAGMLVGLATSGCAAEPTPVPTIGSPTEAAGPPAPSGTTQDLASQYGLTGMALPADWPDVPVPADTEVVSAYAVGVDPRRTWSATFAADSGTALDLAEPVVAQLRERDYVPIAEYVGPKRTNTGLYSFAAETFAIYIVLGEDAGRPNVVVTVRGTTDADAGLPGASPSSAPTATSPSPTGSGSPPPGSPGPSPTGSGSPSPGSPGPSAGDPGDADAPGSPTTGASAGR